MKNKLPLSQINLDQISALMPTPSYDRTQVKPSIVHVGVGGFHRSHEAYYTHQLMQETGDLNWGICGIGLREADRKIATILEKQDYLYTLIVRHPDGSIEPSVIGSLIDFMLSVDDPSAVIDKMANEQTKIVSLTITEGGYNFNPATGEFDFENPDIIHDLAHPTQPRLIFGYLTAALKKRREKSIAPFTIQSCDNVQHNGDMARKMVLAFAKKQDAELATWISENVSFPNAMVDRITPVTTGADMDYLALEKGVIDEWPVTCEPFRQWVIEDLFVNGRPAWESAGAQFVSDVTPYETMKIRLLNAGHSVLGLLGSIHGHQTIDGTVTDPLFAQFLREFMDLEATPVLDEVPGINLTKYKDQLITRFSNPNIKDNLARICLESSAKLPKFLIATLQENLATNGKIERSSLVLATWCYYSDTHADRFGNPLDVVDEMKDELHCAAAQSKSDPLAFLKIATLFGDLSQNERFTALYTAQLQAIYADPDVQKLMRALLT